MIDIASEKLVTLPQATKLFPDRPSVATLWRWRKKGALGRKLESVVLGGKVYTSAEAIQRFAQQQGGADNDAPEIRTPTRRERDIQRAENELREAGV